MSLVIVTLMDTSLPTELFYFNMIPSGSDSNSEALISEKDSSNSSFSQSSEAGNSGSSPTKERIPDLKETPDPLGILARDRPDPQKNILKLNKLAHFGRELFEKETQPRR